MLEDIFVDYELRLVVEKVSVDSQKVVKRDTIKVYDVTAPDTILDLGLRHEEQISLIGKVQNSVIAEQAKLIDPGHTVCPQMWFIRLKRMAILSPTSTLYLVDHKVPIQKHQCTHPDCNWQSAPTTTIVFGTSIHPDLAKLQCEQGALHTYREAQTNLEKLNVHRRRVNNHNKVKTVDKPGRCSSSQGES